MKTIRKRDDLEHEERFLRPAVDIKDNGAEITLVADLPGIDKDSLNIQIDNNILTIEARSEDKMDGYDQLVTERAPRRFKRVFELDESIDQSNVYAAIQDGILTLRLKKSESSKPKKIEVKVE